MNLIHPDGWSVRFIQGNGWCPANRHNMALAQAINWGAHAMVFMGPDHWVEEDCLVKLIGHLDDGWDMAAGWVPSRGIVGIDKRPYPYLAYKLKDPDNYIPDKFAVLHYNDKDYEIVTTGAESQEIHIIGSGILMFKVDVVKDMKKPWFGELTQRDEYYSRWPVQDSHFTYRCTVEGGHRLWLDTTIEAKHLDVFAIDETFEERFKDKTGQKWDGTFYLNVLPEERGIHDEPAEPVRSDMQ